MRAALERVELLQSVSELRAAFRWTGVLKGVSAGLLSSRGLPILLGLARRFPIFASATQFAARHLKRGVLRTTLRVGSIVWLVWQGISLARAMRSDARRARRDAPPAT